MFERALIAFLCLFLTATPSIADWPTASPEEAGFPPDLAQRIDAALGEEGSAKVHAIVVIHDGKLVYEKYLSGDDKKLDIRIKDVAFAPDLKHDVRSISKSVVSLIYGIALSEGKTPPLDAPIVDFFPEHPEAAADPARRKITVKDALTMSLGLEWDEDAKGEANTEMQMEWSADSTGFVLERPIVAEPGSVWEYSGGATNLLGRLIVKGTGMPLGAFAQARLFDPLGIAPADVEWMTDYYGDEFAHVGLRLRPRDMAKLGQLVLDGGRWNGAQIVPADWIAAMITPAHSTGDDGCHYGYQVWLCPTEGGVDAIEMSGNGGQEIIVVPSQGIVVAATGGDYGNADAWQSSWRILDEIVLPALQ